MDKNIGLDFRKGGEPKVFQSNTLDFIFAGSTVFIEEENDWLYTTGLSQFNFENQFINRNYEIRNRFGIIISNQIRMMTWYGLSGTSFLKYGKSIYLFSSCPDTSIDASSACQLLLSEFRYENNQPKVVRLNQVLTSETNCSVAVTRHANGRDWWVVAGGFYGNTFHVFRINEEGVTALPMQTLGQPDDPRYALGNTSAGFEFNNQGNLLAFGNRWVEPKRLCTVSFDRCTGLFNNREVLFLNTLFNIDPRGNESHDFAFSSDDRWLYCATRFRLLAFDIVDFNRSKLIVIDSIIQYKDHMPNLGVDGPLFISIQTAPSGINYGSIMMFTFDSTRVSPIKLDSILPEQSKYLFTIAPDGTYKRKGLYIGDVGRAGAFMPNVPDYSLGPLVSAYAGPRHRSVVGVCAAGDSVQLGRWADTRNLAYQWAPVDGLSDPTDPMPRAKPSRTTTYTLTVRALPHVDTACGGNRSWHSDTIRVEVYDDLKPLNLSIGARVCGAYIELNASNTGFPVIWSTGDTSQTLRATSSGTYTVTSASARCAVSDTISITIRDSAQVSLPADTTWCPSWGLLELRPDALNARRYFWSTRETTPAIMAADTGIYWVRVVDDAGRVGTDSIRLSCPPLGASIDLLPASGHLFIPNAFSPNADGLNETFQLLCGRCVFIELSIYDRWGRLVFESHDLRDAWDGRNMPEGVYAYRVRYRLSGEATDREERGTVSVVR